MYHTNLVRAILYAKSDVHTNNIWERPLMTSDIRVTGQVGGSKIAPKIGRYRVGQGRQVGQKWPDISEL